MNLSEVDWDFEAAGTWPLPVKIATVVIICAAVVFASYSYITTDQLAELEQLTAKEKTLKTAFEIKQKKAVNLQDYREQLAQIEDSLGEMIKQMPTKAEVANLLVDISQTGLASGLEFKLFKPSGEIRKDFYSELPIHIEVLGNYEELGLFISGLASLPRIVTVHNVVILPNKGKKLTMRAVVKTYNEGVQSSKKPAKKRRKRR
ncbi:type 4a pilus biogenesis protein PilO [methane-oxidizing endosymbiont of Gigantopelta aegis]|uniref:type 4a pilus biogenesis protein PilO n=1 Tax=methane-oxidizing endosymbiont of Gigantopelta aegis TaxID=2794938 RepID=UPI0018DE97CA|nr:type 4a pilus biogenesis protein PilO [methane-oxidizing endosymbiont of Gigantopelta aegis]